MKKTENFRTNRTPFQAPSDCDITYFVCPSRVVVDNVWYSTYDIGVLCKCVVIDCIPDISTDFDKVKELVRRCNDGGLKLIHFRDVAEDFIIT